MNSIMYLACFVFISLGVNAQESDLQSIAEKSKETSTIISQELNFDNDRSILLQRAIYSVALSYQRAEKQLADKPEKLKETKKMINESFPKYLSGNFSETEIAQIEELMKKIE